LAWLDQLAVALGVESPSAEETGRILAAARDVAHGVERRITPLSTFVLGMAVQRAIAGGSSRDEALDRAIETLRGSIPSPPPEPGPRSQTRSTQPD
jgi:uncharacterized protein DUF6457